MNETTRNVESGPGHKPNDQKDERNNQKTSTSQQIHRFLSKG